MIKFDQPKELNGAKLIDELLAAGCKTLAKDRTSENGYAYPIIDGNRDFYVLIDTSEKDLAASVIAAHKG